MKHKIFLEAVDAVMMPLPAGFYGTVEEPVSINQYIYFRTSEDKAWEYDSKTAFDIVGDMQRKGYPARCIPPVTITR